MRFCSARASRTGSSPSTAMAPRSGVLSPSTHSIVVVLPAPFGPISPKISPSHTSKDTSSTATVGPYVLRMPPTWITGEIDTDQMLSKVEEVEEVEEVEKVEVFK